MIIQWLEADDSKVLKKFAELIAVNRGQFQTFYIGNIQPTDAHRYGRFGLKPDEAMELSYITGIYQGILMATNGKDAQQANAMIQKEINGVTIEIPSPEQARNILAMKPLDLRSMNGHPKVLGLG